MHMWASNRFFSENSKTGYKCRENKPLQSQSRIVVKGVRCKLPAATLWWLQPSPPTPTFSVVWMRPRPCSFCCPPVVYRYRTSMTILWPNAPIARIPHSETLPAPNGECSPPRVSSTLLKCSYPPSNLNLKPLFWHNKTNRREKKTSKPTEVGSGILYPTKTIGCLTSSPSSSPQLT